MLAHASEGIRLDLKVDTWPVSINVAMPTGLVVNELLTNALKHAFTGRDGGTITLHSLVDEKGCCVVVADNGRRRRVAETRQAGRADRPVASAERRCTDRCRIDAKQGSASDDLLRSGQCRAGMLIDRRARRSGVSFITSLPVDLGPGR